MNEVLGSIWWLLVALGVLVTFHEFGHFWVARRCGVRVLRFSLGFGPVLLSRYGRDGTEYVVSALPLGGYVKFLDEREVEVAPHERHESFNAKSVWQRIAIVAAGPLANLLLAIALVWLVLVVGRPEFQPIVAQVDGLAAEAGFRVGDRLVDIDGRAPQTWSDAGMALSLAAMDRKPIAIQVLGSDGAARVLTLPLDRPDLAISERTAMSDLGLRVAWQVDRPARVDPDEKATAAGLRTGDVILALDGHVVDRYADIGPLMQEIGRGGESVTVRIRRDGAELTLRIDPRLAPDETPLRWVLGVLPARPAAEPDMVLRKGPLEAVPAAFAETWNIARNSLGVLRRMVTGQASLQNVSGPVTIAKVANATASGGLVWFLNFLAILSLSLCIMNLLPIPVLDGGHLLYYLIELVKGSPVGERVLVAGQYVGLVFLAGLMGLAFYNDLFRPSF